MLSNAIQSQSSRRHMVAAVTLATSIFPFTYQFHSRDHLRTCASLEIDCPEEPPPEVVKTIG